MYEWIYTHDDTFRYMLLNRMQCDCEYYLGYGKRSPHCLWAGNEAEQIAVMKRLWNSFSEGGKPEWLTWEQILDFEKKMCGDRATDPSQQSNNLKERGI